MKNKILKEINVEEIMEEIKKNPEENSEFKVLWNGEEIEVYLDYYDFEKEVDEIREKLENLKRELLKTKKISLNLIFLIA